MNPININSLDSLPQVAEQLIYFANGEKFFIFEGEMAAGKTTFIKVLCETLGVKDVVSSPTFSIVNEYKTRIGKAVYHFDFYRIKNLNEAYDIGYEEYFYSGDVCLIEWPEKIAELIPQKHVKVNIQVKDTDRRMLIFEAIN